MIHIHLPTSVYTLIWMIDIVANAYLNPGNHLEISIASNSTVSCLSTLKKINIYQLNGKLYQGYEFSMKNDSLESCITKCCSYSHCNAILFNIFYCNGYQYFQVNKMMKSSEELYSQESKKQSLISSYHSSKVRKRSPESKTPFVPIPCTVGLQNCNENEYCHTINKRRRTGVCDCKMGFLRNEKNLCISVQTNKTESPIKPSRTTLSSDIQETSYNISAYSVNNFSTDLNAGKASNLEQTNPITATTLNPNKDTPEAVVPAKKLVVNISNKTITLAEGSTSYKDWVTLSAYALGDSGSKYQFNWNLVDKPDSKEDGSIRDMNSQTISLSDLVAGVYIFKVSVNGTNSYGEATGNVTVVPAKHVNKPPVAVIVPSSQTVKLPNSGVILDGSGSTDDKKIESLHWELVMGPLGYKLKEETGPTLQMTDLIPGNYTIMLKLKDEEGLEGNSTASVVIVKETDYPPTANAGGDKIIYLPQSEITLNGNMSTDDHEIVEWEWTKGPEDSGNAVDMQDTRTPYLHLSTLEEGHYHLILKVVDSAGQVSNSSAHIYVHSSSDNLLKADAGLDLTIVIPNTTVTLDGSASTGVSSQTEFLWKQLSGPSQVRFLTADEIKTNASELTRGKYVFQLTVWNGEGKPQNSSSNVSVTVIQDKNAAPVANAGGDFSVTLPVSVVIVNGSTSTDDVGVVRWLWKRDAASLAAGTIIKKSDETPLLLFTNVVPGRYVWNLTVWDDQGASSTDTVSIIIKEGPNYLDEVEIVVGVSIENLSVSQLNNLLQKLQLLLHNSTSDITFTLLNIHGRPMSGIVSLIMFGRRGGKVIKGTSLVQELKEKTIMSYRDKILNLPIVGIDTVICQNNCSGHGECFQLTRECRCHSWWMESFWKRHFGESTPNCDWSVVYVFVGALGTFILMGTSIWVIYRFLTRKCKTLRQRKMKMPQYSLLDAYEDNNIKLPTKLQNSLLDSATDTDSETEILFETKNSSKQRTDKHKNGFMKLHKLRT